MSHTKSPPPDAWWDAQAPEQTCSDCGKTGHRAYVQPQWPGFYPGVPDPPKAIWR